MLDIIANPITPYVFCSMMMIAIYFYQKHTSRDPVGPLHFIIISAVLFAVIWVGVNVWFTVN